MESIWSPSCLLLRTKLRDLRKSAGLTQAQLGQRLRKPQSYVSKAESGERNLDFLEVRAYCQACGQSFAAFAAMMDALLEAGSWP